jgi:hypothetical protein
MPFNGEVNRYWPLGLSIVALLIARLDMGLGGAFLVVAMFAGFIFVELFFIRTTILNIYADAITEHRLLLIFLRHRGVNYILSGVISLYLSFYLFIHVNVISLAEIVFFLFTGILLTLFMRPAKNAANLIAKPVPSKVFSRVGLVFIVVLLTVLLDGLYNSFLPIDSRIIKAFDVNIPLYVVDDVQHSYIYLQHFLRTVLFFKYNIQSIGLHEDIGGWFVAIRFLLLLTPTPYIAFALLFLSFSAIKKFRLETER